MARRLLVGPLKWPPPEIIDMSTDAGRPTRKTHYNPAFWLAHWNSAYHRDSTNRDPREQRVQTLYLRSGKIHPSRVENVHAQNGLGLATITVAEMQGWARDELTGAELENALRDIKEQGELILDNENFYCALENAPAYKDTMEVVRTGRISTELQRANVAIFLVSRRYRHPLTINALLQTPEAVREPRWRVLLEIRKFFGMPEWLYNNSEPLLQSHWVLHLAEEDVFPLPDYAPVSDENLSRVWVALSPRILLEISAHCPRKGIASIHHVNSKRDKSLFRSYRRLALRYATTEIIFDRSDVLEEWRDSYEFRERQEQLLNGDVGPGGTLQWFPSAPNFHV